MLGSSWYIDLTELEMAHNYHISLNNYLCCILDIMSYIVGKMPCLALGGEDNPLAFPHRVPAPLGTVKFLKFPIFDLFFRHLNRKFGI